MVFTRTCEATRLLGLTLQNLGLKAIHISGQMSQEKRLIALNKFKSGECNVLICTDVASRGLDIPSVEMVINYGIPVVTKDYIHRVGRTARAGRSGVAISLVNQFEVEWFLQIENLIGKKLSEFPCQEKKVLRLLEDVAEAKKISIMTIKESTDKKRRKNEHEDSEEADSFFSFQKRKDKYEVEEVKLMFCNERRKYLVLRVHSGRDLMREYIRITNWSEEIRQGEGMKSFPITLGGNKKNQHTIW